MNIEFVLPSFIVIVMFIIILIFLFFFNIICSLSFVGVGIHEASNYVTDDDSLNFVT